MSEILNEYLNNYNGKVSAQMVSYIASLENVASSLPEVANYIVKELKNQRKLLKLVASENYSSFAVQCAMGNLLTDKYAEGIPFHRYYAGCENVDAIEDLARKKACELFGAEHAYVQPHSGADANLCAYWAILNHKVQNPLLKKYNQTDASKLSHSEWEEIRQIVHSQKLLGLDYYSGGHLTHGYRQNISAQTFDCYSYTVNRETGLLDYDEIEKQANEVKPLILLAGYSAYPRKLDFKRMSEIAHSAGAVFMVDMSHFAGLVAGKVFTGNYDPVKWADIVTTTTHKTLRGPRGGLILCKNEFAESVDKGCPLVLGGPLPHVMAAKAVAFSEALKPEFANYAKKIVENASVLANEFIKRGVRIGTGGTDNHLMLLDVQSSFGLNGRMAETALFGCGISLNRNALPFDSNGPWYTSGLRIGVPAVTSMGMGADEMVEIADIICTVLSNTKPELLGDGSYSKNKTVITNEIKMQVQSRVTNLLNKFLLYPELDLEFLEKHFCTK